MAVRIPPQAENTDNNKYLNRFHFSVLLAISMFFMPESPMYLVENNDLPNAKKSLQWFRGNRVNVEHELKAMIKAKNEEKAVGSITVKELFTNRLYWQPFLIAVFAMFGQQFCGINVVFFYLQSIFESAGSTIEPGKLPKMTILLRSGTFANFGSLGYCWSFSPPAAEY